MTHGKTIPSHAIQRPRWRAPEPRRHLGLWRCVYRSASKSKWHLGLRWRACRSTPKSKWHLGLWRGVYRGASKSERHLGLRRRACRSAPKSEWHLGLRRCAYRSTPKSEWHVGLHLVTAGPLAFLVECSQVPRLRQRPSQNENQASEATASLVSRFILEGSIGCRPEQRSPLVFGPGARTRLGPHDRRGLKSSIGPSQNTEHGVGLSDDEICDLLGLNRAGNIDLHGPARLGQK